MPGIRRSIRMTSGRRASARATASEPSDASRDHLESRVAGEHPAEAVADDRVVVDDHHPNGAHASTTAAEPGAIAGTRADTAVPPFGSDSIATVPATRATLWRMPVKPNPVAPASPGSGTVKPSAVVVDIERHRVAHE